MTIAFGPFEIDQARFELRNAGVRVPLEPQTFDVLAYLVTHRDRLVSKEELMDQVWGGRFVTESAVTSRIKQARRAVGDDGRAQRVITTVHGRGYRFVAAVHVSTIEVSAGFDPTTPQHQLARRSQTRSASEPSATEESSATGESSAAPLAHGRRSVFSGRPVLIGRDSELATIDRLIDDARAGFGRTVVVSGEPGIGKTMLLASIRSRVSSLGGRVLSGRGVADGPPFRPLAQALMDAWRLAEIRDADAVRPFRPALDRLLPGWVPRGTEPGDPGVDPVLLIAEGLLQILSGTGTAFGLLVVDDAHDADPDSIAVLDHLAASAGERPVLVVVARRDWPRSAALDQLSGTSGAVRLPLSRLTSTDLQQMLAVDRDLSPRAIAAIADRSEGLPVVAAELAAVATDSDEIGWDIPAGFTGLVTARLSSLGDDDRRVLLAAAVLGSEPDWELVPIIAGVDDQVAAAGLRRAVRAHLLAEDDGTLRWRHGLVRQILWSGLLPLERRGLTRAAADALLAAGDAFDSARTGGLLAAAGDPDAAIELWLTGVRDSIARGALRTASELLDCAEDTSRGRTVEVIAARVELLAMLGKPVEALEVGLPALSEARGDKHAELCFRLARAAGAAGRWDQSERLVTRAGRAADPRTAILRCDIAHALSHLVEADGFAEEAVARARSTSQLELLCEALCAAARIRRLHDLGSARQQFAEAAQLASEHGLVPRQIEALFGLATIEVLLDETSSALLEVRRIAVDAGLLGRIAQADLLLADHLLIRDGPTGPAEAASRVCEFGRLADLPYFRVAGELLLASRSALADDEQAMQARLACLHAGVELPLDLRGLIGAVRAQAAMVCHDLGSAAALFDQAMRPLLEHRAAAPLAVFGPWVLVTELVHGDTSAARAGLAQHTAGRRRANLGALRYADAVVAGRAGKHAEAESALAAGDALLAPLPWWRRFLRMYVLEAAVAEQWADAAPGCEWISPRSRRPARLPWPGWRASCFGGPAHRPGVAGVTPPCRPISGRSG